MIAIVQSIRPDIDMDFKPINIIPPFFTRFWKSAIALWFLVALFVCNIFFYFFQKFFSKAGVFLVIIICSFLGYSLMRQNVKLPFVIDAALVGLPFFWLGTFVKEHNILIPTKYDRLGYFVFLPCFFFHLFFFWPNRLVVSNCS